MKTFKYPVLIKQCHYAIYPNYNIYEPLDIKRKQLFERILTHLRNKFMTIMTQNSYKHHSLRVDTQSIFVRLDVLNRKFESVLIEVEGFIVKRITEPLAKKKNSRKVIVMNSASASIKRVDISEKIVSSPLKSPKKDYNIKRINYKINIQKKNGIENKYKITNDKTKFKKRNHFRSAENTIKSIQKIENDFLNKIEEKYISAEKKENLEINQRIRNYHENEKKRMITESKGFITSIKQPRRQRSMLANNISLDLMPRADISETDG